jgi:ATP-dependent Clp protease protease subunit
MEPDKYLTPEEALDLGVIDEILTKRPETEPEKKEEQSDAPKTS